MKIVLFVLGMLLILWAVASWSYQQKINRETNHLLAPAAPTYQKGLLQEKELQRLPLPVQKWVQRSGSIGKPIPTQVYLRQSLEMRLQPEQKDWSKAQAEQHFNLVEPGFLWQVRMPLLAGISIRGRDKFYQGRGSMQMKLASLISVVKEEDTPQLNEGALQRFLAEIVWFPTMALHPKLDWEAINDHQAKATLQVGETIGEGTFTFDAEGDFIEFKTQRFKESTPNAIRYPWICTIDETKVFHGIRIPAKMHVTWHLPSGEWTWLKLEITQIDYR